MVPGRARWWARGRALHRVRNPRPGRATQGGGGAIDSGTGRRGPRQRVQGARRARPRVGHA
eukprot:9014541-Lingulodinium_polyedra.AAC.1